MFKSLCVVVNDFIEIDIFLTFDPEFVLRFGLPDLDYPRSNYVSSINGQQLVVAKTDVLLTPLQTSPQTIFFHMTLPTVEGIIEMTIFLLISLLRNNHWTVNPHPHPLDSSQHSKKKRKKNAL